MPPQTKVHPARLKSGPEPGIDAERVICPAGEVGGESILAPPKVPSEIVMLRVLFTASDDDASMIVNPVVADIAPLAVRVSTVVEPYVPDTRSAPETSKVGAVMASRLEPGE